MKNTSSKMLPYVTNAEAPQRQFVGLYSVHAFARVL